MLLSVLMTAYNAERYLPQAIESVLRQTYRDFEFVIIDDGSTDRTGEIIRGYAEKDSRIVVVRHENMGMGRSLNVGLEVVKGEWVARIDADDEMLPTRLERQLAYVKANPDVAVTATLVNFIDGRGRLLGRSRSDLVTREGLARVMKSRGLVHLHHPAVLGRVQSWRVIGGYRPAFWPAEDVDLWNRVADAGGVVLVQPEYLTNYRIHGSSVCVESARRATRKLEWVEACARARRGGAAEPTWEQFEAARGGGGLVARLNRARRDVARAMYKAATLHYSDRRYHRLAAALAAAAVLEPAYVWEKLGPRLRPGP